MHRGRVVFGAMDEVVFGRPAREAVVEQLDRLGAQRAFLMVSGTLNRDTIGVACKETMTATATRSNGSNGVHATSKLDAVVIGAGVFGLCAALELQRRGRSVMVIDPGGENASSVADDTTRKNAAYRIALRLRGPIGGVSSDRWRDGLDAEGTSPRAAALRSRRSSWSTAGGADPQRR